MVLHSIVSWHSAAVSKETGPSPHPHVIVGNLDHDSIRLMAQHLRDAGSIGIPSHLRMPNTFVFNQICLTSVLAQIRSVLCMILSST